MSKIQASQELFMQLQKQVERAEKLNQPIENLVKQQISLLEEVHDTFVKKAIRSNKHIKNDLGFAEIQIKQLQAISSLCKKIGLSTDKYEKKIHELRIFHLGADFTHQQYEQISK